MYHCVNVIFNWLSENENVKIWMDATCQRIRQTRLNTVFVFFVFHFPISVIFQKALLQENQNYKIESLFSYFSSLFTSPHKLTCSLSRNSCPFRFLCSSFGTISHPSTDCMQDKLLSSLPDDS